MASDGSSDPTAPKSRQERIRDNQRRSRARRQEYLAELERRLNECHVTFREAELQRSAFVDLQAENARLRDLLSWAGISPELIESFGRNPASQRPADSSATSLRQLKPKFEQQQHHDLARSNVAQPVGQDYHVGSGPSGHLPSSVAVPTPTLPAGNYQMYDSAYQYPYMGTSSTMSNNLTPMQTVGGPMGTNPLTPYEWMYNSESDGTSQTTATATPAPGTPFFCQVFECPANGPLLPDDGNTVLCTVAKTMIEQFGPSPEEMEAIKRRLATVFSRPRYPEQGCRVSNHVLFQILNELNARNMNG